MISQSANISYTCTVTPTLPFQFLGQSVLLAEPKSSTIEEVSQCNTHFFQLPVNH